jgi:uncharacterized protein with ParB-like and HNH nuclease domain
MAQTVTPEKQSVEACLKNRTYYIDFYQREYIWGKETVEILLNDIFYTFDLSYAQHKDEDITQEVLERFNWYYLNVFITNTITGKVYIVDGQQRLSTLTLISTKLYHLTTDENLKDTLKDCIFGKDKWKGNIFRIDHDKRKNVMDSILKGQSYSGVFQNRTEETLINRYLDISDFIDKKQMDEKMLGTFISYFLERLVLVELSIDKDDTPMIFEVINDRGEPLKPFQILKGKLIGALNKTDTDDYSQKWDKAISILPDIEDDFFIDLIKSKFIFKRNSKLETAINNAYHRYIYEYNEIADGLKLRKNDKNQISNIKDFINNDIEYYSRLYAKIRKNLNPYLRYNNVINYLSGQYQNILSACKLNDPEEDIKISAIAKEIDRLYVLLRLNGIYDNNTFQEISYSLNEKLFAKSISEYRSIFDKILIEEIKERRNLASVTSVLEYNSFLKKDYTNMEIRSLRYLLARIEQYVCLKLNRNMANDVEYISTKTGYSTGYHIEHILSKNDTNKLYFATEEEFETERNILGGLLLLKDRDNISSGNEEYKDKLKTYSVGLIWGQTLRQDFYHTYKDMDDFNNELKGSINLDFKPIDKFDKDALYYRSKLLYELIKIVWEVN